MPGHVFIVPGDVRRLACDAWLVPCSRRATPHRFRPPHWPDDFPWFTPPDGDQDWWKRERRVFRLPNAPQGEPAPWMVNVVYNRETGIDEDAFYRDTVRQAMRAVLPSLAPPYRPRHRRLCPLLAMPFLGSGLGMANMVERGRLLRMLLTLVQEELDRFKHPVDVALTTLGSRPFAAAQYARLSLDGGWPGLDEPLFGHADRLAGLAATGELSLFIGAGVGVGAGLPTWDDMIVRIAEARGLSGEILSYLQDPRRDALDRASYLAALVGGHRNLRQAVIELMQATHHYSLSHALLAGLPVREAITTNYDQLFEWAWEAAAAEPNGHGGFSVTARTSIIPHEYRPDHHRWLLKLHGCVTVPESLVLTRESYVRFSDEWAALEGLLQGTLLNRHVLFIGFSMRDPNFIRILDTVRRIIRPEEPTKPIGRPFGTALMIGGDEMFRHLYQHDVEWVSLGEGAEGGRRLELFLDCLLAKTRGPTHLLDDDFESVLSPEESQLRDAMLELAKKVPEGRHSPGWDRVRALLREFGWKPSTDEDPEPQRHRGTEKTKTEGDRTDRS